MQALWYVWKLQNLSPFFAFPFVAIWPPCNEKERKKLIRNINAINRYHCSNTTLHFVSFVFVVFSSTLICIWNCIDWVNLLFAKQFKPAVCSLALCLMNADIIIFTLALGKINFLRQWMRVQRMSSILKIHQSSSSLVHIDYGISIKEFCRIFFI